ncbi:MAG: hypothetical protein LDL33_15540 [Desulfomonile sp.]|nr:hypothetical protein [Desulfomonile sp.]
MSFSSIGPGDDVEAWCTRCRMTLNHRVIAVVGCDIKRVHCLTCGSDHKYYPPRGSAASNEKTSRVTKTSGDVKAPKTSADRAASRARGEWNTFMSQMPPGTVVRPYKITESYAAAEYIDHPLFGRGRIVEVVGSDKIEVAFEEGRKVLLCNRKPT